MITPVRERGKWLDFGFEIGFLAFVSSSFLSFRAIGNVGLGLVAVCAGFALIRRKGEGRSRPEVVAMLLFASSCLVAVALSVEPRESWSAFYSHSFVGKTLLASLCLVAWQPGGATLRRLFCYALVMLFGINLLQLAYWWPVSIMFNPEAFSPDQFYRYRNFYAAMQVVLFPFLLWQTISCRSNGWRVLWLSWVGINLAMLAGSGFRGAWLGLFIGALSLLGWKRIRTTAPYLVGAAILVVLLTAMPGVRDNLFLSAVKRGASDNHRIDSVWKPSLTLIAESPISGHGFAPLAFTRAYEARMAHNNWGNAVMPDAHNMFLQLSFQGGWPTGIAYAALLLSLLGRLFLAGKNGARPFLAKPAFAAWLGAYGILGQTDTVAWWCFIVLLPLSIVVLNGSYGRKDAHGA